MSESREIPAGWKLVKLEEVVDEFVRGPFGGSLKKECFVPNGYKVYEQKNAIYQSTELGEYFINENKYQELIRFEVKPADFVVSCSGTIGKLFMIPEKSPRGIINQALLIIRINRDFLLDKFFMYLFTSAVFQRLIINDAKGTAMLNLAGVKDMKLVPVLLPPIHEQHAIVAEIESRLSVCDKIEESIEHSLKQSEALRQSILKKAFEGKLVPQEPNDEPASVLLARIKAEREKDKPANPPRR
jgi:type I restriction enzyme S subunit